MARENPIHNGRLETDLDANNHTIKNLPADFSPKFTRKYIMVPGASSDEQMPTLLDFETGTMIYDDGEEGETTPIPTATELLSGDMVAELNLFNYYHEGGIQVAHDGYIFVVHNSGYAESYEYSVMLSELMPTESMLARIYAADLNGDTMLIIEFK